MLNLFVDQSVGSQIKTGATLVRILKIFRFVKVIRLFRVAKLKYIIENIIEYLALSEAFVVFMGFIKIALIVLIFAEWIGCLWFMLGDSDVETKNWVTAYAFDDFYWAS